MTDMPDHAHHEYATGTDLNGLGGRLNQAEIVLGQEQTKTTRNEKDIAEVAKLVARNAETAQRFQLDTVTRFGGVETSIANSVGCIDKKVSNLKWWILGAAGTLGFGLRLFSTFM